MLCPKCNAFVNDDSPCCKVCGTETSARKPLFTKKQYKLFILLPAIISIVSLVCAFILMPQYDPWATVGIVFLVIGGITAAFVVIAAFVKVITLTSQAQSEKEAREAARDKLLQDILKNLEEMNASSKQ